MSAYRKVVATLLVMEFLLSRRDEVARCARPPIFARGKYKLDRFARPKLIKMMVDTHARRVVTLGM